MEYPEIRKVIEEIGNKNHRAYVKAIVGFELGINNEQRLDEMYDEYMEVDYITLISEDFYEMLEEMISRDKR